MAQENMIQTVRLAGSPYDFGAAMGKAVLRAIHDEVLDHPRVRELVDAHKGSPRVDGLEQAARAAYPQYVLELEGLAHGAEVDFETLFIWNCRGDLRYDMDGGCTTVLLPNNRRESEHIIAHNEDGSEAFHGRCLWVEAAPSEGPGFSSFLYPGMLPGHSFGVNNLGLVQTINNIRGRDLRIGVPRHFVTRAILDCRTLDGAVKLLRRDERAGGFHHNLGQAGDERLFSVEAPATGCDVRQLTGPAAHSNHLFATALSDVPQEVTASSRQRLERAAELLAADEADDVHEQILFDRHGQNHSIFRRGNDDEDGEFTLATSVFCIDRSGVSWSIHDGPERRHALTGKVSLNGE